MGWFINFERRQEKRIKFQNKTITIIHLHPWLCTELKTFSAPIKDISLKGISFVIPDALPINATLKLMLNDRCDAVEAYGHVVWNKKINTAVYEIGVKFSSGFSTIKNVSAYLRNNLTNYLPTS